METKRIFGLAAVLAALCVTACDRAADAPARDHAASESTASLPDRVEPRADDPRDAPVPKVDGKPMWSANRNSTAEENAKTHFEKDGEAFGAKDVDDFVAKAHAFATNPPKGTERIKRANGDTLLYDPKGNVFAVVTKDGAPRTMFKPDSGAEYWATQKTKESAAAKKADRDEG